MLKTASLFDRYPQLKTAETEITAAFNMIRDSFRGGGTLFTCGNGGSAADAEHMIGELVKSFLIPRPVSENFREKLAAEYGDRGKFLADNLQEGFRAVSLNGHPALATAYGNDVDYNMIFAQQLYALGRAGDILVAFTTSGNSVNVLNALMVAGSTGIATVAMTGRDGGKAASLADCCIRVPESETFKVQELHLPVYHFLCAMLEEEFYDA